MKTRRKSYKKGVRGPVVAARGPPVGQQQNAGREIQDLSSATMEEEFEETVPETETAPSGADSGGATATAAKPPNLTHEFIRAFS